MSEALQGAVEMRGKLDRFSAATRKAMVNAMWKFETTEMKEMVKRTPEETGELIASRFTTKPVFDGDTLRAEMGFTADHAAIVHEDLEAFHPKGQAKYMDSVLDESRPHFGERIAESMKQELGM